MILKILQLILKLCPVSKYSSFIGWSIIVFCVTFSCSSPEKKEPVSSDAIENSMANVNENPTYSKVGLLKLSEYGLFQQPLKDLKPVSDLLPYDLNTPLFTDYASKLRFIHIPEGSKIGYREKEVLDFPEGTILVKNFFYDPPQLESADKKNIETRLLIKKGEEWIALPYIWNDTQTEAYLEITGGTVPVHLKEEDHPFEYRIPSMLQCKSCHELNAEIAPIGPSVRQLNKDYKYSAGVNNQVRKMIELGWITDHPEQNDWPEIVQWDNPNSGSLNARARAYLDINCGHCHRPGGPGKNSGLDLTVFAVNDHSLGIGKSPVAAGAGSGGLRYDIVPGESDRSILVFRMRSNNPGIMMPELGRSLMHEEGVELIEEWIESMR